VQFTPLDLIIAGILLFSVVMGLLRGFIREVLSLICWIVAFAVAFNFQAVGATFMERFTSAPVLQSWGGFIGIFIVALLVMSLITMLVYRLFAATGVTSTDKALGAFFGFARGVLIVSACVVAFGVTSIPQSAGWWKNSVLVGYFDPVARIIIDVLPDRYAQQLQQFPGNSTFQAAPDPNAPTFQQNVAPQPGVIEEQLNNLDNQLGQPEKTTN